MPPKHRVSAPPNRIYKASTPLRQAKLPALRKRVGYGKTAGRRIAKVDNTLTQMDFVVLTQKEQEQEQDEEEEEDTEGEGEEGYVQEKGHVQEKGRRGGKRRKTMGDLPDGTARGYHTQTITQLDWSFSSAMEGEGEGDDGFGFDDALEEGMDDAARNEREDTIENQVADTMEEDGDVDDNPTSSKASKSARKAKLPKVSRFYKKKSPDPVLELDTQGRDIYDGPYSSDKGAGNSKPKRNLRKRASSRIEEEDTEDEGGVNISHTTSTPQLENFSRKPSPRRGSRRRVSMPLEEVEIGGEDNVQQSTLLSPEATKNMPTTRVLRASTRKAASTKEIILVEHDTLQSPIQAKRVVKTRPAKRSKKSIDEAPETPNTSEDFPEPHPPPLIASQVAMPPPPTPHRPIRREIPSSQSPAVTPLSAIRTPLREQPINATPIPFNANRTPRLDTFEPRRLEIQDTFAISTDASSQSVDHPTPTKKSSPAKIVRFFIPGEEENALDAEDDDDEESNAPDSPSKKMGSSLPRSTPAVRPSQRGVVEDSDAEDSNVLDSPVKDTGTSLPGSTQMVHSSHRVIQDSDAEDSDLEEEDTIIADPAPMEVLVPEEAMVESNLDANDELVMEEKSAEDRDNLSNNLHKEQPLEKENSQQEPETCYGEIGAETQFAANHLLQPARKSPELGIVDEQDEQENQEEEEEVEEEQMTFKEKTQMMESQRLTTQQVLAMDPRTMDSDVFFSANHLEVAEIVNRMRDYLFRAWELPSTVSRIWIYETKPTSTLTYMAVLGPTKKPKEELVSETGKGNATFHKKNDKWRAYAIFELYELADPLSLAELKSNEWLERAPPKFTKVPPAVLDQLMANLQPPLWADAEDEDPAEDEPMEDEDEDDDLDAGVPVSPVPSRTDTDQATSQLLHTIQQFTEPVLVHGSSSSYPSSPPVKAEQYTGPQFIENSQREETPIEGSHVEEPDLDEPFIQNSHPSNAELDAEEIIPSSQQTTPRNRRPGPSQATTVDLTQTQTETPRHRSRSIILESPIRGIRSSSPVRLPTPKAGSDTSNNQPPDSLVPYSMGSSEIMTKSQMLPESIMADSMWDQVPIVMDSEEEFD